MQDEGDFEKIKSKGDKKKDKLLTMDPSEITYDMVARKLREIALARGKKGVDRQEQVYFLSLPCRPPFTPPPFFSLDPAEPHVDVIDGGLHDHFMIDMFTVASSPSPLPSIQAHVTENMYIINTNGSIISKFLNAWPWLNSHSAHDHLFWLVF